MKRILPAVISVLTWGMLLASLIYLLCIWNTIPEIIGVHFASDGSFDVFDSKLYIAYPYAMGFGFLFLLEMAFVASQKSKSGMKISQTGEHRLKLTLSILINALKLFFRIFYILDILRHGTEIPEHPASESIHMGGSHPISDIPMFDLPHSIHPSAEARTGGAA